MAKSFNTKKCKLIFALFIISALFAETKPVHCEEVTFALCRSMKHKDLVNTSKCRGLGAFKKRAITPRHLSDNSEKDNQEDLTPDDTVNSPTLLGILLLGKAPSEVPTDYASRRGINY